MKVARLLSIFVVCSAYWASDAHAQLRSLGWNPDPAPMMEARRITLGPRPPLPASVDLTPMMPPPGDQGGQGSCVAWATAYGAKTYHEVVEEQNWDPDSTRFQFSPSWVYNQIGGQIDDGAYFSDALDLLVSAGADTLRFRPYDDSDHLTQPDSASMTRARRFKSGSWGTLRKNVDDLKQVLAEGNVIIAGISVLPDFDDLDATNDTYDDDAGTSRGGHGIVITGYDDARDAFSFQNSWGTDWGINGRGWIAYDFITNTKVGLRPYVLSDKENLEPYVDISLYIVAGHFLYRVDDDFGDSVHAGQGVWDSATSITNVGNKLYIIQNSRLYFFDPFEETRTQLGAAVWSGSTHLASINGDLYVIRSGVLWRVNRTTGARTQVGTRSWTGTTSMISRSGYLYVIQSGQLYRVNPTTGVPTALAAAVWTGETHMAAAGSYLWVISDNKLYRVNSSTGYRTQWGNLSWTTTEAMVGISSNLFVIKSGYLYQVDAATGERDAMTPSLWWGNTVVMSAN